MNRLILSQIVKNEEHCILTSLNSAIKEIVDMVVYVDTGSTDNTKEIILNWGKENNIPAYVFDRPFDNFCNSRNYAMEMARQMADKHGWKRDETWSMWLDADETALIDVKSFNKQKMDKDLYMANVFIGAMKYTRNTFARMSKPFKWYGPCHEFIICEDQNISSGLLEGYWVDVKMIGASWKGNIADKYKKHSAILEDYIDNEDRNSRWVFYTAQSYHDSATLPDNREENEERLRRSMKYYQERINRLDGYEEERFYSQFRIGTIMKVLEMPWCDTHQALIKAYAMDPLRGEPIKVIIDHYLSTQEWSLAYVYTKFAVTTLHNNNPYPTRLLFVDESLYNWRFLEVHAAASIYCGKKEEARQTFNQLLDVLRKNPQWFNADEVQKINMNAQFFKNN
jgi:glycosyltransferase involved in cell wall biosynthesis